MNQVGKPTGDSLGVEGKAECRVRQTALGAAEGRHQRPEVMASCCSMSSRVPMGPADRAGPVAQKALGDWPGGHVVGKARGYGVMVLVSVCQWSCILDYMSPSHGPCGLSTACS